MKSTDKLPYSFDLYWDIKTMEDVEEVANGSFNPSGIDGDDLADEFKKLGLPIPDCLRVNGYLGTREVWLTYEGTWFDAKPSGYLEDQIQKVKVKINSRFG